jgi:hypothetical protein
MDETIARYLASLDKRHQREGNYEDWMLSKDRADIAGPGHHVRIVTWSNMRDLCTASGLDERVVTAAYREALETNDLLFVEWEEVASEPTSDRGRLARPARSS